MNMFFKIVLVCALSVFGKDMRHNLHIHDTLFIDSIPPTDSPLNFIVADSSDSTVKSCHRDSIVSVIGAATPQQISDSIQHGVDSGRIPMSLGNSQWTESSITDTGDYVQIREDIQGDSSLTIVGKITSDSTITGQAILAQIEKHDDTITTLIPTGTDYTKLPIFPNYDMAINMISDTANDQIIATINGNYHLKIHANVYSGTGGVVFRLVAFKNGDTELDATHDEFNFPSANVKQRIVVDGSINVSDAPDTFDLRIRHDNGGSVNISATYTHFEMFFLGTD